MIKLSGIKKVFDGRGIAGLHGINLELKEGKIMAVMGPNGSGKTTLINIIAKKIAADQGDLEVEGETRLFSELDNLPNINVQKFLIQKVSPEVEDEKKIQLSRDLADIFEFTFQLRQNLNQLSAGQRQKVLLAGELINRPSLLLLDEPFAHLDPHTRTEILNSLFSYLRRQEIAVLWVTHNLEEALRFSDLVGLLNFGKFEQINTPVGLVTHPRNLFVAQFLGYENFLPIKKNENQWQTPWGIYSHSTLNEDEGILVIPDDAFIVRESSVKGKVTNSYLKGLSQRITIELGNKSFQIKIGRNSPLPALESVLSLQVNLDQCFLIPL
jgi:ABC-type sugar transport system ATPase subunit